MQLCKQEAPNHYARGGQQMKADNINFV